MSRKILSSALVIVGFALLLWITRSNAYLGWDFRNSVWGPAYMLVHHQAPYSYNTPYGPFPSVWMPTILGLLFPLGYLPFELVSRLWLLVEMAGFLWVIKLIAGDKLPSRWVFVECLVVFFLFPPLWVHVILGQFSMMFVILMMVIVSFPQAKRSVPLLLAVGLTKPQLAILVYPGLLFSVWRNRGFRAAARLVLSTGICALLLLAPLFLYNPGWLKDFLLITFDNLNKGWEHPTLFVQLPALLGPAGYALWALIFITVLVTTLWLWSHKDAQVAMIASLAMTPLVTLYAFSWDFLLLLPAFFWLALNLRSKIARSVLLAGMLGLFAAQLAVRWHRDISDGSLWWIPSVLILVYLFSMVLEYWSAPGKKFALLQRPAS